MNTLSSTPKIVRIVDDLDYQSIEGGYFKDANNTTDEVRYLTPSKFNELSRIADATLGQTYLFDKASLSYLPFNNDVEKKSALNMLFTYKTALGYMGATAFTGNITEVATINRTIEGDGQVSTKVVKVEIDMQHNEKEEWERSIHLNHSFGCPTKKSYDEIKTYLTEHGLLTDIYLKQFLEEIQYKGDLTGTEQTVKVELTHNLDTILEVGLKLSVGPFFKANAHFKEKCQKSSTAIYEMKVSF